VSFGNPVCGYGDPSVVARIDEGSWKWMKGVVGVEKGMARVWRSEGDVVGVKEVVKVRGDTSDGMRGVDGSFVWVFALMALVVWSWRRGN
jgi:hypothetical protein